ncbi:MAG: VOC family protein [Bacteroidia bacterium]|nr:VOC family protein [Bacteroidia bacterium]
MMKLTSYLFFNGQAEEAAHFYATVLGGQLGELYRYESMPAESGLPDVPEDCKQHVLHGSVFFSGGMLSVADTLPGDERRFGDGGMLTLYCDSMAQIEEVYAKLSAGAQKISCELGEVYFAKRYAEITDRFGVLWALLYEEV